MAIIGVYDSGIGGLTTLKLLIEKFCGNDFYYLADNAHMPFGSKTTEELTCILNGAIEKLRAHSDIAVLACNTASSLSSTHDVIRLLPPLKQNAEIITASTSADAQPATRLPFDASTLLLATPKTLDNLKGKYNCPFADTTELATLIEIHSSLSVRKNNLDMSELLPYLKERLYKFKGVETVMLGCSHYLYCKNQIAEILGDVRFCDGNRNVIEELNKSVRPVQNGISKIEFDFTSTNETKKYNAILNMLINRS